ncbi:Nicotinate-nucleotide adenylyltransferase [bioreactor metagenome]|uniref:Nicotinate-nucleotide adenylyltransferase n=1 Tax=bioreactor metagenome TaxID=1076179 RepID=A0A645AWM1_9ZZZZ
MSVKIAVMGGTFNPPHLGHLLGARRVISAYDPDLFLMIPTGIPPHKIIPDGSPCDCDRLNMVKLMVRDDPKITISDMEMKRKGKSYTVDTLKSLKEEYKNASIDLIMGADMLYMIEKWHHFEELFGLCRLVVIGRKENQTEELKKACLHIQKRYGADITLLEMEPFAISSSQIREKIKNEEDVGQYLHPDVYRYIRENNLYLED